MFDYQKFLESISTRKDLNRYDYSNLCYITEGEHQGKLKIYCKHCNQYFYQTPSNHKQGKNCNSDKCHKNKKISKEQFFETVLNNHTICYDYSETVYTDMSDILIIKCPIHSRFKQRARKHYLGKDCPKCMNQIMNTEDFINKANIKWNYLYDYSKVVYLNTRSDIIIICPIHGEYPQRPNNHLSGNGCPVCNLSKGELAIHNYLKTNNIPNGRQRFVKIKNKNLSFDFYLPNHNMYIEYDGKQHFEPMFGRVDKFKKQVLYDSYKNEYCSINNIKLLRISYLEFNDIEQILKQSLFS